MTVNRQHALYRFYSADGELLYVGITVDPGRRFPQHQLDKPWWHEVSGITLSAPYPNRESAAAAERLAIEVEAPRYNIQRPSLDRSGKGHAAPKHLVWVCEACQSPVADGEGYLHVSMVEVRSAERAIADERDERDNSWGTVDINAFLSGPGPARWRTHHAGCDPEPDDADYWIDVARVRTHAHLLARTAHLMGKAWLSCTDWDELIDAYSTVET